MKIRGRNTHELDDHEAVMPFWVSAIAVQDAIAIRSQVV